MVFGEIPMLFNWKLQTLVFGSNPRHCKTRHCKRVKYRNIWWSKKKTVKRIRYLKVVWPTTYRRLHLDVWASYAGAYTCGQRYMQAQYLCVGTYTHMCKFIYAGAIMCVGMCVGTYTHMYVHVPVCTHKFIYRRMCIYMYTHVLTLKR